MNPGLPNSGGAGKKRPVSENSTGTVRLPNNAAAPPSEEHDQLDTLTGQGLPATEITLAEMFRRAGYATAHIGKWHLGSGVGHKPLDHGFDYSFGFMGGCIDNYTHFFYWAGPNRHDLWENNQRVRSPGHYFPDLMVEKAEAFIGAHRTRPSNSRPGEVHFKMMPEQPQ